MSDLPSYRVTFRPERYTKAPPPPTLFDLQICLRCAALIPNTDVHERLHDDFHAQIENGVAQL